MMRPCLDCGVLIPRGSRCTICQRAVDSARWRGWRERRPTGGRWQAIRRRVMERDGWTCQLCGAPADEVDHVVPWSMGGTDDLDNLRALCRRCHRARRGGFES